MNLEDWRKTFSNPIFSFRNIRDKKSESRKIFFTETKIRTGSDHVYIMLKLSRLVIKLSIIIQVSSVDCKKLITIGKNMKTSLTPYNTIHTAKAQQCFTVCHYDKQCYSMEIIQTTFYHCNFYDQGLKITDLDIESPGTKVYLQIRNCQDLYNLGIRSYKSWQFLIWR